MRYLFFDLEFPTSAGGVYKICELGYVLTNENFEVIERNNLLINPKITRREWDRTVVENILTREILEYELKPNFTFYYPRIKDLILSSDYVVGHSLDGDTKAINDECLRYELDSIDFDFYDIKYIYKWYSKEDHVTSVVKILEGLNIQGEEKVHDAETDAFNTMLGFKKLFELTNMSLEEIVEICPEVKDRTEKYIVQSIEKNHLKKAEMFLKSINGDGSNDVVKGSENLKRVKQFIDNVKKNGPGKNRMKGKRVVISKNYRAHHFRQILNLIQIIVNEGGKIVTKLSQCNTFVKYDVSLSDGTLLEDIKLDSEINSINGERIIDVIDFYDLLDLLEMTEEELDALPPVSFEFLLKEGAIIKDKKERDIIENQIKKKKKNGPLVTYVDDSADASIADIIKAGNKNGRK